jgi:hypothetical protein
MKTAFTSVYHPQSNDTVDRANTLIFEALKKILEGEKRAKWAEVMSKAIWSHNTSVLRATNFWPFWLLFRAEAITPKEIKHKSSQTMSEALPCPTKPEDKEFFNPDKLKVVTNLQKYQVETKARETQRWNKELLKWVT